MVGQRIDWVKHLQVSSYNGYDSLGMMSAGGLAEQIRKYEIIACHALERNNYSTAHHFKFDYVPMLGIASNFRIGTAWKVDRYFTSAKMEIRALLGSINGPFIGRHMDGQYIQTRGAPIPAGVSAVSRSKTRDCNVIHLQDKPGHVMFPNALQHGRITRMRVLAITDEKSRCFKRTFSSCFEQYGRPTIDLLESSSPHGVPRK
ncbi:hypothetical protein BJ166DRAFT_500791 [Pestalotiopsis sp. NC0098]|nr:hypothetical protein BJ166DRAFT_500791 [Pestalotiopsis sp. NC0098]